MSFFNQFAFEGKAVDGSEENTTVQTSSIVPGGTKAVSVLEEIKWDEYEGHRKIKVRWKLAAGEFTGRVVFQNLDLFAKKYGTQEPDENKAFRAANTLKRLFMLTGAPIPDAEPTDADFAQMVGKMAGIAIEVWAMNGREGNWVSEIQPSKGFENVTGTELPKEQTQTQTAATQPATTQAAW